MRDGLSGYGTVLLLVIFVATLAACMDSSATEKKERPPLNAELMAFQCHFTLQLRLQWC